MLDIKQLTLDLLKPRTLTTLDFVRANFETRPAQLAPVYIILTTGPVILSMV